MPRVFAEREGASAVWLPESMSKSDASQGRKLRHGYVAEVCSCGRLCGCLHRLLVGRGRRNGFDGSLAEIDELEDLIGWDIEEDEHEFIEVAREVDTVFAQTYCPRPARESSLVSALGLR